MAIEYLPRGMMQLSMQHARHQSEVEIGGSQSSSKKSMVPSCPVATQSLAHLLLNCGFLRDFEIGHL